VQQLQLQPGDADVRYGFSDRPAVKTFRRLPIHGWAALLALGDLVGVLAFTQLLGHFQQLPPGPSWAVVSSFLLMWGLVAHSMRIYGRHILLGALRLQFMRSAVPVGLVTLLELVLVPSALATTEDQTTLCIVAAIGLLAWVWGLRFVWHQYAQAVLQRGQCIDRALLLTGSADAGSALREHIEHDTMGEVRVAAITRIPSRRDAASAAWIEGLIRTGLIDRVFVAGFSGAMGDTNALLGKLSRLAVDVTLVPDLEGIGAPALRVDQIGPRPVVDVNLIPLSTIETVAKRLEDLLIVSLALPFLIVVFAVIAIAIKLDSPGPVFFRQWRAGFHDHRFRMWKFRTMHHAMRDEGAELQTSRTDRRVTRVGRLLRATSLDELPQLLNVLVGDMSVVGPRPHALGMTATGRPLHEVIADYPSRHRVKPGITGWAQVCGCRGEVDSADKLRRRVMLDCYYIEKWSLAFDFWIILRTAGNLLFARDAY
jgi:Undecaprenyl-phosphate glucose phosphotransferase